MKRSLIVILISLILLACLWWLTGKPLNAYLSLHRPLDGADILLVEGWLSKTELGRVARVFTEGDYDRIVTSGTSSTDDYQMGKNGTLVFHIIPPVVSNEPAQLNIVAHGNLSDDYESLFEVYANEEIIGIDSASNKSSGFTYEIPPTGPIEKISVNFLNNAIINGKARYLLVSSISLNNQYYSVFDTNVYFRANTSNDSAIYRSAKCKSAEATYYLEEFGIESNKIIEICTEKVIYSKTFSTACNTIAQLDSIYSKSNHKINVISASPHCRRTYLSYIKAAPGWNIGIISLNNDQCAKYSRLKNIQELSGIMLLMILKPGKQHIIRH